MTTGFIWRSYIRDVPDRVPDGVVDLDLVDDPAAYTADLLIEITDFERPKLLASVTTMAQADIRYVLHFEPVAAGTRMSWSGQVRPKGALHLLGPLIVWLGRRQERRNWQSMKVHLEHEREGET